MKASDPILIQAERIFSQRRARCAVIDSDILGEPGWDILLCAFIAQRKGLACSLGLVVSEIGLGPATAARWIDLLARRKMLVHKGSFFSISEDSQQVLIAMFQGQIREIYKSLNSDLNSSIEKRSMIS